eukprot:1373412-Pleurochrysis_carterae.AAC.3
MSIRSCASTMQAQNEEVDCASTKRRGVPRCETRPRKAPAAHSARTRGRAVVQMTAACLRGQR